MFLFQGWQVYKDARLLRQDLQATLKTFPSEEKFALIDQARRAMLSVILQTAEGSNRKTANDKALFINRALTSLDEVMACMDCALDDNYITQEKYQALFGKIENLAKQFRGLEKHIRMNGV